ncbi:hypothetical protein PV327_000572 [Microctonus hyperodae]|uniref:Uncharacterized protein n=1 Tax=Microctonus hyperodae TaxID=165561 RepID=A0AA39G6G5_MICHY|nr:hypothetical protein PV327_000572 [Microctonus hyperodae]
MGTTDSSLPPSSDWIYTESSRILNTAATVVSITSDMVAMVFRDIEDFLTELSGYGEQAQHCISQKRSELKKARDELIHNLVTCYKTRQKIFDRLKLERIVLHDEAVKLKQDAEINLAKCSDESDTNCQVLNKNLTRLSTRANTLVKKTEIHSKKEFSERRKNIIKMIACDRKAVEQAYKATQNIIKDIKDCMFSETKNPMFF